MQFSDRQQDGGWLTSDLHSDQALYLQLKQGFTRHGFHCSIWDGHGLPSPWGAWITVRLLKSLPAEKQIKREKKKKELFIHEDVDWNAEIWPVHSFDLVMIRKTVQFRAAGGMWMWIRICLSRSDLGLFNHLSYSRSSNESWRSNDGQHK